MGDDEVVTFNQQMEEVVKPSIPFGSLRAVYEHGVKDKSRVHVDVSILVLMSPLLVMGEMPIIIAPFIASLLFFYMLDE